MKKHPSPYVEEIESILDFLHRPKFHRLWTQPTRPGEWCGRFQLTQSLALLFAALHHFTGREVYARMGCRYLLDFDRAYHFGSVFCATAYQLLSRRLSRAQRRNFALGWTLGARGELDKYVLGGPGGDPARIDDWNNVSNHALCACVQADYARRLFPKESAPLKLEAVTDRVWRVWWARREFQEQASNYEGFSEAFLCAWAVLRGVTREFFASPSVLNMLERNSRVVTPAGIVAAYGDSGHNEHATAWLALFEKAARETRNGGWSRIASDIFGYLRRRDLRSAAKAVERALNENIYNGRVLYGHFIDKMAWLAMAALWRDPELAPTARGPGSGVNRRLPHGYALEPADKKRLPASRMVACQVALEGGPPDPARRTCLLLSVGPALVHDHADAGAILMLSRGDTLLLGTNGYLQRELMYHNIFYAQEAKLPDYPGADANGGLKWGSGDCAAEILELRTGQNSACCRIHFKKYHHCGEDLSLTREVVVGASGSVTVIDRAVARAPGLVGGPLFHGERIRRTGPGMFRLRLDMLRSMCGMELRNAPGEMEVETVWPTAQLPPRRLKPPSVYTGTPVYRQFPCRHYVKVWRASYTARVCLAARAPLLPGEETVFITRLTPVAPKA